MTTMTDLTKERLDEIEAFHWGEIDCMPEKTDAEMRALVAMAKRTEQAERERDTLLDAIVHADLDSVAEVLRDVIIGDSCEGNCECVIHGLDRLRAVFEAALAQPTTDAGGAE